MVGNAGNDFIDASRAEQGVRIVADEDDDEVIGSSYADSMTVVWLRHTLWRCW